MSSQPLSAHAVRPVIRPRPALLAAPPAAWAALVLAGHLLAARLVAADPRVHIGAPPLVGSFDVRISWAVCGAVALAAGAVIAGPALVARMRWSALVASSWLAGVVWIVAL